VNDEFDMNQDTCRVMCINKYERESLTMYWELYLQNVQLLWLLRAASGKRRDETKSVQTDRR